MAVRFFKEKFLSKIETNEEKLELYDSKWQYVSCMSKHHVKARFKGKLTIALNAWIFHTVLHFQSTVGPRYMRYMDRIYAK